MGGYRLAQVNVADAVAPLGSEPLAGFLDLLGPLDDLARSSPGFVWRPRPQDVTLADLEVFGDPRWQIVNLSVWESVEALRGYLYGPAHAAAMRRRRDWFRRPAGVTGALWWVPSGERPGFAECHRRLELVRALGPSPDSFTLTHLFPPPTAAGRTDIPRPDPPPVGTDAAGAPPSSWAEQATDPPPGRNRHLPVTAPGRRRRQRSDRPPA